MSKGTPDSDFNSGLWDVVIQCPHCKKEIQCFPIGKSMLKVILRKHIKKAEVEKEI